MQFWLPTLIGICIGLLVSYVVQFFALDRRQRRLAGKEAGPPWTGACAEATDVYLQVTSEQASSIAHTSMTASCPRGVVVASPWLWIGWTRWSWWSTWGHELSVAVSAERPDCLHFQCSSRPRMRTVLVDLEVTAGLPDAWPASYAVRLSHLRYRPLCLTSET